MRLRVSPVSDYSHQLVTSTRDRLLDAAVALVAQRGLRDTTIDEIEEAAGLTRGGRGFYRHFDAKEDVLVAAFERHLEGIKQFESTADFLPLGDLRAELTLICRAGLIQMEHERTLVRILEKEGDRFPEIRHRLRESMVNMGHRQIAEVIERYTTGVDADALAVVLLGGIVNYRRGAWTFDRPALDVDEERFVNTWVATAHTAITAHIPEQDER